jgi:hypothetical protein
MPRADANHFDFPVKSMTWRGLALRGDNTSDERCNAGISSSNSRCSDDRLTPTPGWSRTQGGAPLRPGPP